MNDERVAEDTVTKFFLNTCRLRPQLSQTAVQAVESCAGIAAQHPDDDTEAGLIPLTTGSVAEFYLSLIHI